MNLWEDSLLLKKETFVFDALDNTLDLHLPDFDLNVWKYYSANIFILVKKAMKMA